MATTSDEEEDVCPLCLEPYRNPCYLTCGNFHTLCLEPCLTDLVRHHRGQRWFPCPLDRNRVAIPAGGATAFQRVSADNGRRPAGSRRPHLLPNRRSGPATTARNSQPPPVVREQVTRIPTPRTPGRQPNSARSLSRPLPDAPPLPGLIDDSEIQQQATLWQANMQLQMELANLNVQRLLRETRQQDEWISPPQVQVTANATRTFVPANPTRGEGTEVERQRERISWLMGKEQRRQSRLLEKQEVRAEKEQRKMERRAEKEERRREKEQRKRERREEKEQRKREIRMERELRRQERVW